MDVEGCGRGLIWGIIVAFAWKTEENETELQLRKSPVPVKTETKHLPNVKQKYHCLSPFPQFVQFEWDFLNCNVQLPKLHILPRYS